MEERPWNWNLLGKIVGFTVALLIVGFVILELVRPGSVMCPLRRLAGELDIPVYDILESAGGQPLSEASKEKIAQWQDQIAEQHPNLIIQAQPLPEAENGYWQLYHLRDSVHQASPDLIEILSKIETCDPEQAKAALAANEDWVKHVEWIASLTKASSTGFPDKQHFLSAREVKYAHDTLLLKAVLAAKAKDEPEALRCAQASANLIDHLQTIEAPTLMSETIRVLCDLARMHSIMKDILPALGAYSNVKPWEAAIKRIHFTPANLAKCYRGEWHHMSPLVLSIIAVAHEQRMLVDPEATAMTYAAISSHRIRQIEASTPRGLLLSPIGTPSTADLSPEGRELLDVMDFGAKSWNVGYLRACRVQAIHQAAIELLAKEPCFGELSDENVEDVTPDPLTGAHFLFDAKTRTLSMPAGHPQYELEAPLKLPW